MVEDRIMAHFQSQDDCLSFLEGIRWGGKTKCPYCGNGHPTSLKGSNRYHCNGCNCSFSVLVRTALHNTKIDLRKWFVFIYMSLNTAEAYSVRGLADHLKINCNTAQRMNQVIKARILKQDEFIKDIALKLKTI